MLWRDKADADFRKALSLPSATDAALAKPAQEAARARLEALAAAEAQERANAEAIRALAAAEAARASTLALPDPGCRVALVIGNSEYKAVPVLPNPRRDAEAVAALRKVGFETVIAENDLTRSKFIAALRAFEDKAEDADWAVVYCAGHGVEIGGANYLVPVDATLRSDRDVQDEAIPLDRVLLATERARKLRLVILDACRENPFLSRMRRTVATRSIGRGLARIEPEECAAHPR